MLSLSRLALLAGLIVIFSALVTQKIFLKKENDIYSQVYSQHIRDQSQDNPNHRDNQDNPKSITSAEKTVIKSSYQVTKIVSETSNDIPSEEMDKKDPSSSEKVNLGESVAVDDSTAKQGKSSTNSADLSGGFEIFTLPDELVLKATKSTNKNHLLLDADQIPLLPDLKATDNTSPDQSHQIHIYPPSTHTISNNNTSHAVLTNNLSGKSQTNPSPQSATKPHNEANHVKKSEVIHNHTSSPSNHTNTVHKDHGKKKHKIVRLHEPARHNYHPNISPRKGTDISPQHRDALLRCHNQTKCIIPELQLKVRLKVYFCRKPVRSGARFYFLAHEGLLNHPNVELLEYSRIDEADLIFYLPASAPWHLTECTNSSFAGKLVVLDEFDGHSAFLPYKTIEEAKAVYGPEINWYLMFFKRSYVTRLDGVFMSYPHISKPSFYPLVYSLAEWYMADTFHMQREIDIVCTLRGHKGMRTRLRAQQWVEGYYNRSIERGKPLNVIMRQADTGTRVDVSRLYFENMYNTKIVVTVNPSEWEGDFRLWETMGSGALVFVDPVFVPHRYPLIHGKHVIHFDNQRREDLWEKLDYYLANPKEARRIAEQGYLYAMKYHRTVSMIDHILISSHVKLSYEYPEKYGRLTSTDYMYTAQYLHRATVKQARQIKINNYPGNYTTGYIQ